MPSLPKILQDQNDAITLAILATKLMHFDQFDWHCVGRKVPHTIITAIVIAITVIVIAESEQQLKEASST